MSSLQARLRHAIGAAVLGAVSLSLLFGAYLVRRSLEQSAFNGLRRQVALLADESVHPPAGSFGRTPNLSGAHAVVFPSPGEAGSRSHASILFLTPILGFLTRTAAPAVSYPMLYPHILPYSDLDVGLNAVIDVLTR